MQRYPGPLSNRQRRAPPGINPARMSLVAKGSGLQYRLCWTTERYLSCWTLARLMIFSQRWRSRARKSTKAGWDPPVGCRTIASMPARTSESAKVSSMARLSWATIDAGVLGGANTPYQLERSSFPNPNSARVGIPGSSETRLAAVIARTLTMLCRRGTGLRRCRSKIDRSRHQSL